MTQAASGRTRLRLARTAFVVAVTAAGAVLSACGEDEEDAARQEIEETVIGYGESEGEEFCGHLSASALDQLGGESGCVQEYERVGVAELEVEEISLTGSEATVRVDNLDEGGDTFELQLVNEDQEWKVSEFPGLAPIAPEQAPLPPQGGTVPEQALPPLPGEQGLPPPGEQGLPPEQEGLPLPGEQAPPE
jgi:hypothetical protein